MQRFTSRLGWGIAGVLAILVVASVGRIAFGGPLDPPVGVGTPTGKTVITSVPYTISAPGSYVLNSDLACYDLCYDSAALSISSLFGEVTLDLQGFHLVNGTLDGIGIDVTAVNSSTVEIRNGVVRASDGDSIQTASLAGMNVKDVKVESWQGTAVLCNGGDNVTIESSTVIGSSGIRGLGGCTVVAKNNIVRAASGMGIEIQGSDGVISGNIVEATGINIWVNGGSSNAILENAVRNQGTDTPISVNASYNQVDGNVIDGNGVATAISALGSFNVVTRNRACNVTTTPFADSGANNTFGPTQTRFTPLSNPWANVWC
jgi:hypothetical protein